MLTRKGEIMKKLMSSFLILSLPFTTIADVADLYSVIVQNNETVENFVLSSETVRTEYRTEVVQSTCYREEIVGYETVCDYHRPYNQFDLSNILVSSAVAGVTPRQERPARPPREPGNPGREPGDSGKPPRPPRPPEPPTPRPPSPRPPEPRPPTPRPPEPRPPQPRPPRPPEPRPPRPPEPRPPQPRPPVCYQKPIYRTVAYSCMQTVTVPYQVRNPTRASVVVNMTAAPATRPQTSNCGINFAFRGVKLDAYNTCSEYIAIANKLSVGEGSSDSQHKYSIALFDGVSLLAPLAGGLTEMRLENGRYLLARVGNLNLSGNFSLRLRVERKRLVGNDSDLINRPLRLGEYTYEDFDGRTGFVRIDFNKLLGGIASDKKHEITLSLSVTLPAGNIIPGGAYNNQDLNQSQTIVVR